MTTHIVTLGGGGFSMTAEGTPTNLDRYLVELTGRTAPMVCFVPTASADDPNYIRRFLTAYGALGVRTMVLTLWQNAAASVARLAQADLVVVGGGSTVNLLALWRAHGVDRVLLDRIKADSGLVLAGISAGANCWYSSCLTDSYGDLRPLNDGLRLLPGSFCTHWDGESERQTPYIDAIVAGDLPGGYAADDGAALHWVNGELRAAIAEQPGQRVLRFEPSNEPASGGISIEPVAVEVL